MKNIENEFLIETKYKRSPRLIRRVPTKAITIAKPPAKKEMSRTSLAQIIITPLVMICITVVICFFLKRGIYVIMSVASTTVSIIASVSKYIYDKKDMEIHNKKRDELYDKYLLNIRKQIYYTKKEEEETYIYNYPTISQIESMINNFSSRIYERNANDEDFLTFSIGHRTEQIGFQVNFAYNELEIDADPLEEEAYEIKTGMGMVPEKPVVINLKKNHVGLVGEKDVIHKQLNQIITQIAFSQSYHDVQIINIFSKNYRNDFSWTRWLPHVRIQSLNVYGNIDSERMRDQILGSLHQIIKERKVRVEESKKESRFLPHFVFIIDEPKLIVDHSIMEYLNNEGDNLGISIIYTSYMQASLPENMGTVVIFENSNDGILLLDNKEVTNIHFKLWNSETVDYENMARNLSILTHEQGIVSQIPESITFLDMYHVERPNQLNIEYRWQKGETHKSLAVPLGVRAADDLLYLNLHERAHGPHGLVAGTTGSGKSEIIQSYILSLSVNFHPYEVCFLLIDYKGGGMAGLFQDLPHLLGTITNLDGSESMRAMVSIKSELARRQRIFAHNNVNHIHAYGRLFKEGKVKEPIPHLFLICDEFAELKKEQPDFMKELVSAARIGRSLGIHLILATQKPSGVVDDQIWTNSHFKLALKVQNEADSKEILKTSDAALITQPGRAYLQVGNNEIYELFQSAWSGAVYSEEKESTILDDRVYIINELGQGELVNGETKDFSLTEKNVTTQLDVVIKEIKNTFNKLNISKVKRPWLPPLTSKIISPYTLQTEDVSNKEGENIPLNLYIPIGLADIPEEQCQVEYGINLIKDGNIAYFAAAGYGKSVFLETVVLSLALKNGVDKVNFYICDFGNNALIALNALPHTSDYIAIDDNERLLKMISILQEEMKQRKKLFAQKMVQNFDVFNQSEEHPLKAIIVVVDNYDIVKEISAEVEEFLMKLGRDGQGLGIFMIITASRSSGVRYTAMNNYKNKIVGYLLDQNEYTGLIGKTTYKPAAVEGRTLVKGQQVSMMQVFTMVAFRDEVEYNKNLKKLIEDIIRMYPTKKAPRIPILPDSFSYPMIEEFVKTKSYEIFLGLHKASVELCGFNRTMSPFIIIGDSAKGKTNMVKVMVAQAMKNGMVYLFDSKDMELYFLKGKKNINYINHDDEMEVFLNKIKEISKANKKAFEAAIKNGENMSPKAFYATMEPIYIIIDDLDDFTCAYQKYIKEAAEIMKTASESGVGIIATIHSSKPRKFDEVNTWFRTSSNGLVIGSQGTAAIYPAVSNREMPVFGEGLLYYNSNYEKLLLPKYE